MLFRWSKSFIISIAIFQMFVQKNQVVQVPISTKSTSVGIKKIIFSRTGAACATLIYLRPWTWTLSKKKKNICQIIVLEA